MELEKITSVKNPLVRTLRGLKDKKGREESGLFLVEGQKLIREAALAGLVPAFFLFEEGAAGADLTDELIEKGAEAHPVSRPVLEAIADTVTPQGCVAAFSLPGEGAPLFKGPLVALDGVQDPGNVGTIWRTADAAGFKGLLLGAPAADPFSPKVQRAAMGSGFRLPARRAEDLAAALRALQTEGFRVLVTALDGESMAEAPKDENWVLVIGSEARGVSEEIKLLSDRSVRIPLRGGAESLNAAVAAGICMYWLTGIK